MRCALFTLLLSAGTLAFGQAGPAAPLAPFGQAPSPWAALNRDFGRMTPQQWNGLGSLHSRTVLVPPPKQAVVPLGDASIDPQIVRHPSAQDLGTPPPGTQVAQNLFPGLTFQPIDGQLCAPKDGLLSTTWPKLEVRRIPITWPNLKMEPITEPGQASPVAVPGPHP